MAGGIGVIAGILGFGRAIGSPATGGPLNVAAGVGVASGVGFGVDAVMTFGAGVDGGSTPGSGFGFILVIKKDILTPDPFGNHSMKLYEGK